MADAYAGMEGTRPYQGISDYYSRYRSKLSDGFVNLVMDRLGLRKADRLLDLGTGPGQIALRFAPRLAEVVGLDLEPDQVQEARTQAKTQGIANAVFEVAGSDDLERLRSTLGAFRVATMGESFHWMLDRDRVLRDLSAQIDPEDGAVLLITTGVLMSSAEPLARARRIVRRVLNAFLKDIPAGPHPRGRHDPFEAILQRSPFPDLLLLQHEYEQALRPTVDDLIYPEYTISHVHRRLGERREAFEAEVHRQLADFKSGGPLLERRRDAALVGRRRPG